MEKKINKLFNYRKLPFLINTLSKKDKRFLRIELVNIQKAIYQLDAYLEKNWKIKEKKLNKLWKSINMSISVVGFDSEEIYALTAHIRKYQLHELQLRDYKLPTRLKLEYFYYYKSCDVRLMRDIIYKFNQDLIREIPLTDWRLYDLVTEINDDVEDIFEDQFTINGNYFLISIVENGLEYACDFFTNYLMTLKKKSISKFGKANSSKKLRIHYLTMKRIEETISLIKSNASKIEKKGLNKEITIFKYLE